MEEPIPEEKALRELWDKRGVPKERQNDIIRDIELKARPGARVVPFIIGLLFFAVAADRLSFGPILHRWKQMLIKRYYSSDEIASRFIGRLLFCSLFYHFFYLRLPYSCFLKELTDKAFNDF